MRGWFGILWALALVTGLVSPALAGDGKPYALFTDLDPSEWSVPYVAEVAAKGLMQGTGDGRFEPGGTLTRAQAITVAVRLLGLESRARAPGPVTAGMLPYLDGQRIPDWARPYVAVAVEKDIIPPAGDGLLLAGEQASRLWVSVLLVRALGLQAEAQAKMAVAGRFADAHRILPDLTGYVAAAVDHELILGFPDLTFRPHEPLTRAQTAALLVRADYQLALLGRARPGTLDGAPDSGQPDVTGTLAALSLSLAAGDAADAPGLIRLVPDQGDEQIFALATGAAVLGPDDLPLSPDELQAGDRVAVRVTAGVATRIQLEQRAVRAAAPPAEPAASAEQPAEIPAAAPPAVPPSAPDDKAAAEAGEVILRGSIIAFSDTGITLRTEDGQERTVTVPGIGQLRTIAGLRVGDWVKVVLVNGRVMRVGVADRE